MKSLTLEMRLLDVGVIYLLFKLLMYEIGVGNPENLTPYGAISLSGVACLGVSIGLSFLDELSIRLTSLFKISASLMLRPPAAGILLTSSFCNTFGASCFFDLEISCSVLDVS